jgi:hypothetical protein
VHDNELYDIDYNKQMVEWCKAFNEGGFVKAYRNQTAIRIKEKDYKRTMGKDIMTNLTKVRDMLEDVFCDMCDAWCDYKSSSDFDETQDELFNDDWDWDTIKYDVVTTDNITAFL